MTADTETNTDLYTETFTETGSDTNGDKGEKENKDPVNAAVMAQMILNELTNINQGLKNINIVVIGKTGTGKSTLLNAVFGENMAKTGTPITPELKKYQKRGAPLTVWESRGPELSRHAREPFKQEVSDLIDKVRQTKDPADDVHCIWYCIDASLNRIEDEEIKWINDLTDSAVPVILVLMNYNLKQNYRELWLSLRPIMLKVKDVINMPAQGIKKSSGRTFNPIGLFYLLEATARYIPEELIFTLMCLQKADIDCSAKEARKAVQTAVETAETVAGASAFPIPPADCARLIPVQVTMLARITAVHGLEPDKLIINAFLSSALGAGSATLLGKSFAGFLKGIPHFGTAADDQSSQDIALILTMALGEAYIGLLFKFAEGEINPAELSSESNKELLKNMFAE